MTLNIKSLSLAIITSAAILTGAGSAQAHTYEHIDGLALTLQRQTATMHDEVHAHFRRTPDYAHLDRDVAEMERLARHIHEVAHHGGSIAHLRADLERLDHLFHHVEDVIARLAGTRQIGYRTISHFRHVMSDIDDTLHHLRDDVAEMSRHRPVAPTYRPTSPTLPFGIRIRW